MIFSISGVVSGAIVPQKMGLLYLHKEIRRRVSTRSRTCKNIIIPNFNFIHKSLSELHCKKKYGLPENNEAYYLADRHILHIYSNWWDRSIKKILKSTFWTNEANLIVSYLSSCHFRFPCYPSKSGNPAINSKEIIF